MPKMKVGVSGVFMQLLVMSHCFSNTKLCGKYVNNLFRVQANDRPFEEPFSKVNFFCKPSKQLKTRLAKGCHDAINPRMLTFSMKNITIPIRNTTYLSRSAKTTVYLGGPKDYQVFCRYNGTMAAYTTIRATYIPRPGNITCISKNLEDMICRFKLQKKKNVAPCNWTMAYRRATYDDWLFRTAQYCGKEPYEFKIPFDPFIYVYQVKVIVTSLFGNYSEKTQFSPWEIVRPSPAASLNVSFLSNQTINLSWSLPSGFERYRNKLEYIVTLNAKDHVEIPTKITYETSQEFHQLIPFFKYDAMVQIRSRSAKNIRIYLSKPRHITFTTKQSIPLESVTFNAGSYSYVDCDRQASCSVLYWKNPGARTIGGPLVRYSISIKPQNLSKVDWQHHEVVGPRVSAVVKTELVKDQDYIVAVKPATEIGYSHAYSCMYIPVYNKRLKVVPKWVVTVIDSENQRVLVRWATEDDECMHRKNVTFYTCRRNTTKSDIPDFVHCQDIDWFTVELNDTCSLSNQHWLNRSVSDEDVMYAVSMVNANGISGGMVWQFNVFNEYNAVPSRPHYTVQSASMWEEGTAIFVINVTMTFKAGGKIPGGIPEEHHIYYKEYQEEDDSVCPYDGKITTDRVDFSRPSIVLKGVQPGSRYIVCAKSSNEVGFSQFGDLLFISVVEIVDTSSRVILAVSLLGSILFLTIVAVSGRLALRKWKALGKEMTIDAQRFEEEALALSEEVKPDVRMSSTLSKQQEQTSLASDQSGEELIPDLANEFPDPGSCSTFESYIDVHEEGDYMTKLTGTPKYGTENNNPSLNIIHNYITKDDMPRLNDIGNYVLNMPSSYDVDNVTENNEQEINDVNNYVTAEEISAFGDSCNYVANDGLEKSQMMTTSYVEHDKINQPALDAKNVGKERNTQSALHAKKIGHEGVYAKTNPTCSQNTIGGIYYMSDSSSTLLSMEERPLNLSKEFTTDPTTAENTAEYVSVKRYEMSVKSMTPKNTIDIMDTYIQHSQLRPNQERTTMVTEACAHERVANPFCSQQEQKKAANETVITRALLQSTGNHWYVPRNEPISHE